MLPASRNHQSRCFLMVRLGLLWDSDTESFFVTRCLRQALHFALPPASLVRHTSRFAIHALCYPCGLLALPAVAPCARTPNTVCSPNTVFCEGLGCCGSAVEVMASLGLPFKACGSWVSWFASLLWLRASLICQTPHFTINDVVLCGPCL